MCHRASGGGTVEYGGALNTHEFTAQIDANGNVIGVWQTAVQYHAWHALALFGVGLLILHFPDRVGLGWGAWLFVAGIALFSGSLYALALTGVRYFGAITPVGGVAFLAGWLVIAWTVARA